MQLNRLKVLGREIHAYENGQPVVYSVWGGSRFFRCSLSKLYILNGLLIFKPGESRVWTIDRRAIEFVLGRNIVDSANVYGEDTSLLAVIRRGAFTFYELEVPCKSIN